MTNQKKMPNIVLIYCDDIGFSEIGAYDGIQMPDRRRFGSSAVHTPNIDSLSREGATFTRYYVTSAVCTPSRYSLLTGRYASRSPELLRKYPPPQQALVKWDAQIDQHESTIGHVLQNMGYRTGFVGKWHCGHPPLDLDKKYADNGDLNDPTYNQALSNAYQEQLSYLRNGFGFDFVDRVYFGNRESFPKPVQFHNLEWLAEGAEDFIHSNDSKPFFLNLSLSTPHEDQGTKFYQQDPLITPGGRLDQRPKTKMPNREQLPDRLHALGVPLSTAMSTWQDDCVGAVLQSLENTGVADDTIVIFTSDHLGRGKFMCYEGSRVPFLIKWPKNIPQGILVDDICANIDVVATLVDLAGGSLPDNHCSDGMSFAQQLLSPKEKHPWRDRLLLEASNIRGIVTDRWKYIACRANEETEKAMKADRLAAKTEGRPRYVSWDGRRNPHINYESEGIRFFSAGAFPSYFDPDQLYDLDNDLMEQHNVANKEPGTLVALKMMMSEEIKKLPHSFGEFKSSSQK